MLESRIMKKLLAIVVLGSFWCNVGLANNDLNGKRLECELAGMKKYIEFGSLNKVIEWDYMPSAFKYWKWKYFYKAEPKFVRFYRDANFKHANPSELNRETLRYGSYDCKIINDFDVESYLNEEIEKLKKAQQNKNKL